MPTHINPNAITSSTMAFQSGWLAARDGKPKTACTYQEPRLQDSWEDGWNAFKKKEKQ